MVHHFIHKITVVAHHNDTTFERLQVFFQDVERYNIQVVGWLIEHQKVRVAHQYRTKMQAAFFATA